MYTRRAARLLDMSPLLVPELQAQVRKALELNATTLREPAHAAPPKARIESIKKRASVLVGIFRGN